MLRRLRSTASRTRRLAIFGGASFALHALTLVGFPPSGVLSAPHQGPLPSTALHATLAPQQPMHSAGADAASPPDAQPPREATDSAAAADALSRIDARHGAPGGADLPFPDKWYSATEVDVRAEPLSEINLDYPDELEGSGIPGRVTLVLYIDERGVVRRTAIAESEPAKLFDRAALRAWIDVKFSPAKKAGVAVKSRKVLEVAFRP